MGQWTARLRVNGVSHYLGAFADEADAARADDRAALDTLRHHLMIKWTPYEHNDADIARATDEDR